MRIVMEQAGFEYRVASERPIRTPADASKASQQIAASETECFVVLSLNAKNGMIESDVVTAGLVDAALVHPREAFRK